MLKQDRMRSLVACILAGMVVTSLLLAVVAFAVPTPALAGQNTRATTAACGSCGLEKRKYWLLNWECGTCHPTGCGMCPAGQICDYC